MFRYLHNGTYHTDTSDEYMSELGLDDDAKQSILSDKEFEQAKPKPEKAIKKAQGIEFNGVNVSLSESNQNGLSALKSALDLAKEFKQESEFFPVNFNAETSAGIRVVVLNDENEFKQFGLAFILARKSLFE